MSTILRSLFLVTTIGVLSCRSEDPTNKQVASGETPIADAGQGGTYTADQPISLNGDGSYDPDGDEITYHWSFNRVPEGSTLTEASFTINETTDPQTSFLADTSGTFIVDLVVIDSNEMSSVADSTVVLVQEGQVPIAEAGSDVELMEGESTSLSGMNSADPLGRDLTYEWAVVTKPADSTLTGVTSPTSELTDFTPDSAGRYLISLVVFNGVSNSLPDTVTVDVMSSNPMAPISDAGEDLPQENDCSAIQLNGSASMDPNGDPLDYLWALQSKPADSTATNASISDVSSVNPTLYADVAGDYVLSLAVYDGFEWSLPDLVSITAGERVANTLPVVEAGASLSVDAGDGDCELSGYTYSCSACAAVSVSIGTDAGVSDGDGDPFTHQWYVMSGSASISDEYALSTEVSLSGASPTEPNACETTSYELELVATDCPGGATADAMTISVTCCGVEIQ